MTETNPRGVISTPSPLLLAEGEDFANDLLLTKQGRMQFGIELRIIDGDGTPLPWDGEQAGALQVRGPWVRVRYFPDFERAGSAGWRGTGGKGERKHGEEGAGEGSGG